MANLDSDNGPVVYFYTLTSSRWWWKRHEVYLGIENESTLMKRYWRESEAERQAAWLNDFFETELLPPGKEPVSDL